MTSEKIEVVELDVGDAAEDVVEEVEEAEDVTQNAFMRGRRSMQRGLGCDQE